LADEKTGVSTPVRHWQGHQLAHKDCFNKRKAYEQTHEYKVEQAQIAVENAEHKLNGATYELAVAKKKLQELLAAVE
jgi:hypothetical protein